MCHLLLAELRLGRRAHCLVHPSRHSFMTQQLQQTIDAAWESRVNLSPSDAPAEVREVVEHVINELNNGKLRVATRELVGGQAQLQRSSIGDAA